VLISAFTGEGIEELLARIDAALPVDPAVKLTLRMPLTEGRKLALVHALGRVLSSTVDDGHMRLDAEVPASVVRRLKLREYVEEGTFQTSSA